MGEVSADTRGGFEEFARQWFAALVALLVRVVRDPAVAYDLATESIAVAQLRWESAPPDEDEAIGWLLRIGAELLEATVERGRVPSLERRRGRQVDPYRLSLAEQQEIARQAEAQLDLPPPARDGAAALARSAPPPHLLRDLRLSGLVEVDAELDPEPEPTAEPPPDREAERRAS